MELDDTNDFGFVSMTLDEVQTKSSAEDRLQQMYKLILPLIDNLLEDADSKPIINWPNRAEKLQDFKDKLGLLLFEE